MNSSAIILCAGAGTRMGVDKMRLAFAGWDVRRAVCRTFEAERRVRHIIVVAPPDAVETYRNELPQYTVVAGGATRRQSVLAALAVVEDPYVLIHDGARPQVSAALVGRVLDALTTDKAVIPTVPLTDSIVGTDGVYRDRAAYRAVQTPQGFDTALLRRCCEMDTAEDTDEGALVARHYAVTYVEGETNNRKLTHAVDYYGLQGDLRQGIGYDIHRIAEGRRLVLCGVPIPCEWGLLGHSDADAPLHALMDAALSAVGLKDIGYYFPATPQWKDADSAHLVGIVRDLLAAVGARVVSASIAIVAEAPRLAPYVDAMRTRVAAILDLAIDHVGITVTTNEGVAMRGDWTDLAGEGAIAAMAVAVVQHRL